MPTNATLRLVPAETTVLFGAGVGVLAGAPTAKALIADIGRVLILDASVRDKVVALVQPDGPLRFESAMDALTDSADPHLHVLALLDDLGPGPLHDALAWIAVRGASLVTVNFDDLAEQAIAAAGALPLTVDAHAHDREELPPGHVEVLKLHGTRRGVLPSSRPLHATIGEIVKSGRGAGLAPAAFAALNDTVAGRDLVILGYSGSDDLDVMPSLQRCSPRHVCWLAHADRGPGSIDIDDAPLSGPAKALLSVWREAGIDVSVILGDTAAILRETGWVIGAPLPTEVLEGRVAGRETFLTAWALDAHRHDPNGLAPLRCI